MSSLKDWLTRGPKVNIPGVVYSEDWIDPHAQKKDYTGSLRNLGGNSEFEKNWAKMAHGKHEYLPKPPEEEPYTKLEQAGFIGVHPSRSTPRQFYMPTTDFAMYEYDEISPEEQELMTKWTAKMINNNPFWVLSALSFSGIVTCRAPIPVRMTMILGTVAVGTIADIVRVYTLAAVEREQLDDFILAKEVWYMKNVEAYQLRLPLMARGSEEKHWTLLETAKESTLMAQAMTLESQRLRTQVRNAEHERTYGPVTLAPTD